jgi:hypothetical protein
MSQPQSKYLAALSAILLSSAILGAACQSSAPAESKEPPSSKPAPAAAPAAQAAQPLKAAEPSAGSAAPAEAPAPTAVKLAGSEPSPAADAPKKAGDKDKAGDKAPAASAAAGGEKQGAVVSEDAFSAWLQTASPAKAGGPVQLEAVLVAKPPYHCNPEYPHKFKLNPAPAGLAYPEETVRGMKVTPERSVLAIPVNAQSAGKPTVSGTLSFSVCTEERCMVEKRDLSVALDVM